jgi:hypothetical protein
MASLAASTALCIVPNSVKRIPMTVPSVYQPFTSISRVEEESTEVIFRVISVNPHTETSNSNRRGDLPDLELLIASLRITS